MQHIQCFLVCRSAFPTAEHSDRQPDQGQAGAQGIEDGVALGIALFGATRDEAEARLEIYDKIRRDRASAIQILSNAGVDQTQLIDKDILKYTDRVPSMSVPSTHFPTCNLVDSTENPGH
jgi:hypothetical protein